MTRYQHLTTYMHENDHEQLIVHVDRKSTLKVILSIHNTTMGPALGPPRMAPYQSDEEAILEALRFSQAQTLKYAAADLPFGGGRIIVLGDPEKEKSETLVRSLGRFVDSMGGRYLITGGGAGFTDNDTLLFTEETSHIIGLPTSMGGSGEPAEFAAYGIFLGMVVCAREVFGIDSLKERVIALQGFGKVGSALAQYLKGVGVKLLVSDVRPDACRKAHSNFQAEIVDPEAIYDAVCDIFSPCAWGGVLNSRTIPRLRCKVVAGSANNQLHNPDTDARALESRGILYAPDYIINAGGFINITAEIGGYDSEKAKEKIADIPKTLETIISEARNKNITPLHAANIFANKRIIRRQKEGKG